MITYFHFNDGSNPYMAYNDKAIFFMICHYDLDMVAARSFDVLGYRAKYLDKAGKKEVLRNFAKHYQSRVCEFESSWLNECEWSSFFENYGRKYGLLREFRENGINMSNELNLEIARKCFASLVLDHEWKGCPELKLKPAVYCRVLVDGWYVDSIYAPNRAAAIEKFMTKSWRR